VWVRVPVWAPVRGSAGAAQVRPKRRARGSGLGARCPEGWRPVGGSACGRRVGVSLKRGLVARAWLPRGPMRAARRSIRPSVGLSACARVERGELRESWEESRL